MTSRQIAYGLFACLFLVIASFWATLRVLDYRYPSGESRSVSSSAETTAPTGHSNTLGPHIIVAEATYGLNCAAGVKVGNATQAVAAACGVKMTNCAYVVTIEALGDPAPGCPKDFTVKWHCDGSHELFHANTAPESAGQTVHLNCP